MDYRKHMPRLVLTLLALSLTGAIAARLSWVQTKHVIRVHSRYGCKGDNAMEMSHRLWPLGEAIADGQWALGCDQSETIDDVRIVCVCE